jgi:N-acetylglucosamine kinase-like BadF-type ATPase
MILIADSGSSKIMWCLISNYGTAVVQFCSNGINPYFQSVETISNEIVNNVMPQLLPHTISAIHYYGAGCGNELACKQIKQALSIHFTTQTITIQGDLIGAARALCGHSEGVACILGTGSNSCLYNGEQIMMNTPPLGYILGDEGSGAALGKQLLSDCFKNKLPKHLAQALCETYQLDATKLIEQVYKQPNPNRFLASFSLFIHRHKADPYIHTLIKDSFISFIKRNVLNYQRSDLPMHSIGSVAYYYKEILHEATNDCNIELGEVIQSPMDGLIGFHTVAK